MAGNLSGPAPGGKPYTSDSQRGFTVRVNGTAQGVRDNVNFVDDLGVVWTAADDPGNDRVNVSARFAGEVLLGTVTADLLASAGPFDIVTGLTAQKAVVTRVLLTGTNIVSPTVAPQIEIGTDAPGNPPNNDVVSAFTLGLTATDQVEFASLVAPQPVLKSVAPVNVLRARRTVAPSATAFTVRIDVLGYVVEP